MTIFPPVTLQAFFLVIATIVWRLTRARARLFLPLSLAAMLAAWGLIGWSETGTQQDYARLRRLFPYESMAGRLPRSKADSTRASASAPGIPCDAESLDRLEEAVEREQRQFRGYLFERLHERTVALFVNSPGFGVTRMLTLSGRQLKGSRQDPPLPQPGLRRTLFLSPGDLEFADAEPRQTKLQQSHEEGLVDFVYPEGFPRWPRKGPTANGSVRRGRSRP